MIVFPAIWGLFPAASLLLIGFSLYLARTSRLDKRDDEEVYLIGFSSAR